jgi:hypothetical protein
MGLRKTSLLRNGKSGGVGCWKLRPRDESNTSKYDERGIGKWKYRMKRNEREVLKWEGQKERLGHIKVTVNAENGRTAVCKISTFYSL